MLLAFPKKRITNSIFPLSKLEIHEDPNSRYSFLDTPRTVSRLITRYITANVCRNVFRKSTKKNQKKNIINPYVLSLLSISSIRPRHGKTTLLVPSNRFFSKRTKSEDRFSINRADVGVLNKSPKHDVSLCRYPPPPPFPLFSCSHRERVHQHHYHRS